MTYRLTARRVHSTGDVLVLRDGREFGRFANCEVAHVFVSDDEELADAVEARIEADMSLGERLAAVRAALTRIEADRATESAMEHQAEGAWIRHAERPDPEAQADLELHEALS